MSRFTKKSKPKTKTQPRRTLSVSSFRLTPAKLFAGVKTSAQKDFRRDPIVAIPIAVGGIAILISLIVLGFHFKHLPPEVPLYYSRPWGAGRLAVRYTLWLLPLLAASLLAVNTLIGRLLYHTDPLMSRLVVWGGCGSSLLLAVTLIQIVLVVPS
jgi:hypothetical protein